MKRRFHRTLTSCLLALCLLLGMGVTALADGFTDGSSIGVPYREAVDQMTARGVLNGVGDAFFSFLNGIVEIAGRIGLPLLLLRLTDIGVWSIWVTAGVTWFLAGTFCLLRYFTWRKRTLLSHQYSDTASGNS